MFPLKKNYGRAGYVDDPSPNIVYMAWHGYLDACLHCVALLCIQLDSMMVSGKFLFSCLVCGPLEKSEVKQLNNLIYGGFGSTWGHNFCTGTHNGSKLEI